MASEARQAIGIDRGAVGKARTPRGAVHRLVLWAGGLSTAGAICLRSWPLQFIALAGMCRVGASPFGGDSGTTGRHMRALTVYNADDAEVGGHGSGHYGLEA